MSQRERKRPVKLQRHCWELSQLLSGLWTHDPETVINKDGVAFEYPDAAEWLDLAAGVDHVEIVTGYFDEGLYLCESALGYENARSDCMSRFAAQLTIFTFVWGAFEIVGKLIAPPAIPASLRARGEDSLVDRLIYYINPIAPTPAYQKIFSVLKQAVVATDHYSRFLRSDPVPPFIGVSGTGIDLVRRIRNQFAHGAAKFPSHNHWGDDARPSITPDQAMIAYSTEIALLTIQMVLDQKYEKKTFEVPRPGGDEEEVHHVLRNLSGASVDEF